MLVFAVYKISEVKGDSTGASDPFSQSTISGVGIIAWATWDFTRLLTCYAVFFMLDSAKDQKKIN